MVLMVHSLSEFPINAEREYYVYVLRGSWDSEIEVALKDNFFQMADAASRSQSAVIFGTDGHHFQNEVFSWHSINGENAEPLLPAILITTVHPAKFRDEHDPYWQSHTRNDHMVLVPLRDVAKSGSDAVDVLRNVFTDIRGKKQLQNFEVFKSLSPSRGRAFMDGLLLRPSFMGMGFDLKTIPKIIGGK
jgi:hypothetical protein